MAREYISKRELLHILNKELLNYEECKDCHFDGIMKLEEEDEDGCNWLGANVKLRCNGVPDKRCGPIISKVMSEAGKKYNIKIKVTR